METKRKINLEQTALDAINSLIAYRTQLDNEYLSYGKNVDSELRQSFLKRYYAITELADEINQRYNPMVTDKCETLR